jgi:hypothetical protein
MNIGLVGPPDAGRKDLLLAIREMDQGATLPDLELLRDPTLTQAEVDGLAVGRHADYRTEIQLAVGRARDSWMYRDANAMFSHTLLDSSMYTIIRLADLVVDEDPEAPEFQRWLLTTDVISQIVRDSYRTDLLLYLPARETDWFVETVEDGLERVFRILGLDPVRLEGTTEQQAAQAIGAIHDHWVSVGTAD